MRKILILLLFGCFCFSEEIILDREITEKKIEELEKIKEGTKDPEILKRIYPVLIEKYDKQAEYGKKHRSMKEYAEILYPEKEKQAEYLKNEADKLREQGEIGEAIMIYKFIGQEYPLTNKDKGSLLQLGEIFKNEMDKEKVIFYYSQVMQKYEPFITESEWWEIIKNFDFLKQYYKAIELSEKFLQKFEDSKYREDILFTLGNLYRKIGEIKKAQNVWEIYIKEYPTSIKNNMIEKFFKEEVKK